MQHLKGAQTGFVTYLTYLSKSLQGLVLGLTDRKLHVNLFFINLHLIFLLDIDTGSQPENAAEAEVSYEQQFLLTGR